MGEENLIILGAFCIAHIEGLCANSHSNGIISCYVGSKGGQLENEGCHVTLLERYSAPDDALAIQHINGGMPNGESERTWWLER